MSIVISTDVAAVAVDDNDTVAVNGGISEMNAHSEQKSIAAAALELLEYVATDTGDRAWRAVGVLRLLTVKRTTEPLGGEEIDPLVIVMMRLHPFNAADAAPEANCVT